MSYERILEIVNLIKWPITIVVVVAILWWTHHSKERRDG